ncbi:hypothetical protein F0562_025191 [Nyssa sinensis]|uniref:Uncharacterized protein n=1 Tax=Nyssa sinensis TaxID=561372 RepID=A0A5J5BHD7_9ASTE|nr:hypothetical protein F0562_025191 [Nyssa sinensis]
MHAGELYLSQCIPLHTAALKGGWKAAEHVIKADHTLVKAHITQGKETALHVAAAAEHVFFVAKLVEKMNENDLELQNKMGNTALCFAAATGNVQIAQLMVDLHTADHLGNKLRPSLFSFISGGHKLSQYEKCAIRNCKT